MSAENKHSVYFGKELNELLSARGGQLNRSATINLVAARYMEVVRHSMPRFRVAEWGLIFDAIGGPYTRSVSSMPSIVAGGIKLDGLATKWHIDGDGLTRTLSGLEPASMLAIVDASDRFWDADYVSVSVTVTRIVGEAAITR